MPDDGTLASAEFWSWGCRLAQSSCIGALWTFPPGHIFKVCSVSKLKPVESLPCSVVINFHAANITRSCRDVQFILPIILKESPSDNVIVPPYLILLTSWRHDDVAHDIIDCIIMTYQATASICLRIQDRKITELKKNGTNFWLNLLTAVPLQFPLLSTCLHINVLTDIMKSFP